MHFLDKEIWFPDPEMAEEDGLLAVGGDLSPKRLMLAYRSGIFPWFIDKGLIYWFSLPERMVLFTEELHISRSMQKGIKQEAFRITENQNFPELIRLCARTHSEKTGSTWISKEFIAAYEYLHKMGHARSVEVWQDDRLVGGIYGVVAGEVFCGESMFSLVPDASKMALVHLCRSGLYRMIDAQVYSLHMQKMGARILPRAAFIGELKKALPE